MASFVNGGGGGGKSGQAYITTASILASGWSNGVYSGFSTTYNPALYNIEIQPNGSSITDKQLKAWSEAKIVGFPTSNDLKALGTVPTVDIPVILRYSPTGGAEGSVIPSVINYSNTNPVMDGTASPGTMESSARADHVHPSDSSKISKTGGTMTGALTLSGAPTANLHAATKQYVDNAVSEIDLSMKVSKSGDTMTGSLIFGSGAHIYGRDGSSTDISLGNGTFHISAEPDAETAVDIGYSTDISTSVFGLTSRVIDSTTPTTESQIRQMPTRIELNANSVTAPTPAVGDDSTKVATTEFVQDAIPSSKVFVGTYGTTTYAEINAAYNAGKHIIVSRDFNGTTLYVLTNVGASGTYHFRSFGSSGYIVYGCYIGTDGVWHVNSNTLATQSALDTGLATKQKTITVSTEEPTSADGVNGDIWFVYEE